MRRLRFSLAGDGTLLQELAGTRRGTVADIAGLETLFEVKDVFGDLAENILQVLLHTLTAFDGTNCRAPSVSS